MAELSVKTCSKCKTEKHLNCFNKDAQKKDGLNSQCSDCKSALNKNWYANNKQRKQIQQNKYRESNKDRLDKKATEYRQRNKKAIRSKIALWQQSNKDKVAFYASNRRARQTQATPLWLTNEQFKQIEEFYSMAKELETVFPWKQHVDHIIPINGKTVCGLHVPWNLQILSMKANLAKGNSQYE